MIDSYAIKEQGSQNREVSGISNCLGNNALKTNDSFPSTYDDTTIVPIPLIEIQDKRKQISSQDEKIHASVNSIRRFSNAPTLPSLKLNSTALGPLLKKHTENKSQAEIYNNLDAILPVKTLVNKMNISYDKNSNTKFFSNGLMANHNKFYEEANMNAMRNRVIKTNITQTKSRNTSSMPTYNQSEYNFAHMKDAHLYEESSTKEISSNQYPSENDTSTRNKTMSNNLFSFGIMDKTKGIKSVDDFEVTSIPSLLLVIVFLVVYRKRCSFLLL